MTAGAIARTDPRPRLALATAALVVTFAMGVGAGVLVAPAVHGASVAGAPTVSAAQANVAFVRDETASYNQPWLIPGISTERAFIQYLRGEADSYGASPLSSLEQAQMLYVRGETGSYGR